MRNLWLTMVLVGLSAGCPGGGSDGQDKTENSERADKLLAQEIELYRGVADALLVSESCDKSRTLMANWRHTNAATLQALESAGAGLTPADLASSEDTLGVRFRQIQITIATALHKCKAAADE